MASAQPYAFATIQSVSSTTTVKMSRLTQARDRDAAAAAVAAFDLDEDQRKRLAVREDRGTGEDSKMADELAHVARVHRQIAAAR
jgi:hypothetical protein